MRAIAVFFIFVGLSGNVLSQENHWGQFRGKNAHGIAPENARPPLEFGPEHNIKWKTSLHPGFSSPCIVKDKIVLTGFNKGSNQLIISCLDRADGSLVWEYSVAPDSLEDLHAVGNPASTTPASNGKNVFVYFGSYGVLCLSMEGDLLWEKRLPILNGSNGSHGSPIVHNGMVIISRNDRKEPEMIAFNCDDGSQQWKKKLEPVDFWFQSSQATPVIWKDEVLLHRLSGISSYSVQDGSFRWYLPIVGTGNATPVILDDILYLNSYWNLGEAGLRDELPAYSALLSKHDKDKDGFIHRENEFPVNLAFFKRPELGLSVKDTANFVRGWVRDNDENNLIDSLEWSGFLEFAATLIREHGLYAIKLNQKDQNNQPVLLWKEKEKIPEVPSPLVYKDRVYMVADGGILTCLSAEDGRVIYRERLGAAGAYLGSPILADEKIYIPNYNGVVTVLKTGDTLEVIAKNKLNENIGSSPIATGNTLYIRTTEHLFAFEK